MEVVMELDKDNTDMTWRRRLGRRLSPGEVDESRTRGGYLNGRTVLVLAISLAAVLVAFGVAYVLHGHV